MHNLYHKELAIAVQAAKKAGDLIRQSIDRHQVTEIKTCASDLVTEVDRQAEVIITDLIATNFPNQALVGEEGQGAKQKTGKNTLTWYVDPLDGTTNFVFGIPLCCVSIALTRDGKPVLGVIHDPFREETYTAIKGCGAKLNGQPISVNQQINTLEHSLLVTGYPGNIKMRPQMHQVNMKRVIDRSSNLRALGTAALELAYVASGRLTGFWEVALSPWDVAAGMVIVEEAGGQISRLDGRPLPLTKHVNIVATNGLIHQELIQCLEWRDNSGN